MKIKSELYDVLKWLVMICIPAIIVFLNTCLPLWGCPTEIANVIVTTISAVATLIGSLIAVSTVNFYKH